MSWGTGISVTNPTVTAVYADLAATKILNHFLRPRFSVPLRVIMGTDAVCPRPFDIPSPLGIGHNVAVTATRGRHAGAAVSELPCRRRSFLRGQEPCGLPCIGTISPFSPRVVQSLHYSVPY
jgi:hypothetical protein